MLRSTPLKRVHPDAFSIASRTPRSLANHVRNDVDGRMQPLRRRMIALHRDWGKGVLRSESYAVEAPRAADGSTLHETSGRGS